MAELCTPDPSSSRVPVHSALVQKSVTVITNLAGRLSGLDARAYGVDSQVTLVKKMAIELPAREISAGIFGGFGSKTPPRHVDLAILQQLGFLRTYRR
jgi:hypothetical protein